MKIFANKEIKKLFLAVSVIWVASLLLTQGLLMVVLSAVFFVPIACFRIGSERAILAVGCSYFKKQNQDHGTGGITASMRILTAITMPVLNVMRKASYIGCFILLILWPLS